VPDRSSSVLPSCSFSVAPSSSSKAGPGRLLLPRSARLRRGPPSAAPEPGRRLRVAMEEAAGLSASGHHGHRWRRPGRRRRWWRWPQRGRPERRRPERRRPRFEGDEHRRDGRDRGDRRSRRNRRRSRLGRWRSGREGDRHHRQHRLGPRVQHWLTGGWGRIVGDRHGCKRRLPRRLGGRRHSQRHHRSRRRHSQPRGQDARRPARRPLEWWTRAERFSQGLPAAAGRARVQSASRSSQVAATSGRLQGREKLPCLHRRLWNRRLPRDRGRHPVRPRQRRGGVPRLAGARRRRVRDAAAQRPGQARPASLPRVLEGGRPGAGENGSHRRGRLDRREERRFHHDNFRCRWRGARQKRSSDTRRFPFRLAQDSGQTAVVDPRSAGAVDDGARTRRRHAHRAAADRVRLGRRHRNGRHGGSPRGGSPRGGSPRGGSPRGGSPRGGSPRGGSPRGGSPRGGSPRGGSPRGGSPRGDHRHKAGKPGARRRLRTQRRRLRTQRRRLRTQRRRLRTQRRRLRTRNARGRHCRPHHCRRWISERRRPRWYAGWAR
jgi:hypothetical protein